MMGCELFLSDVRMHLKSAGDSACNALEWNDEPSIPNNLETTVPVLEVLKNMREVYEKQGM